MNNETVDLKIQLNELQQQLQSYEMENKAKVVFVFVINKTSAQLSI